MSPNHRLHLRHKRRGSLIRQWLIGVLTAVGLCSCSDETHVAVTTPTMHTQTVAVVLPMKDGLEQHWKSTLNLCNDNLRKAFSSQSEGIDLNFEYYDEGCDTLGRLARSLARRDDVVAVIGGLYTTSTLQLAPELCKKKTFFSLATAEEPVRAYTSSEHLWAMTETDITQCEVLLSKAAMYGAETVALIARDDDAYGKTFIDWFGFQAKELGMTVGGIFTFTPATLSSQAEAAMASGADCVICIPSEIEDMEPIIDSHTARTARGESVPRLLFSDTAYGADVLKLLGSKAEGVEGVCFGSDPESGFDVAYEVRFGRATTLGEAQVYDAAMMIGLAGFIGLQNPNDDLTACLRRLVDGREPIPGGWTAEGLSVYVKMLAAGARPDIRGASGTLDFDSKVYTNVLTSVYRHFLVYQGRYITLDHHTSDGSKRSDPTLAGWAWKAENMQHFNNAADRPYPPLRRQKALLVAASSGWENYRHQADVYNMYRILRSEGYAAEDIIVVAEDDIAHNDRNPEPGVVRVAAEGPNVYEGLHIDYRPSEITSADVSDILCGRSSERLPRVIEADSTTNVLLFWSGHGSPYQLRWLDTHDGWRTGMARQCFEDLHAARGYRKLLCLFETCYSGSVACEAEGIPGILCITAAAADETSKADNYSRTLGTWMSNRFTSTLQTAVDDNPDISMRDLYYRLFTQTVGSHVTVYNADFYGNLYTQTLGEFIIPVK